MATDTGRPSAAAKEIIDAIEFLKSKGIIFKDKYHILDQLDKQEALSYYLEKIHGGKK